MAKRCAYIGVFVTVALAFSYVETLIPLQPGIPGIKLGLANLVILIALNRLDTLSALGIDLVRILLSGLLFGSGMTLAYSLVGGILSFLVMWLLSRLDRFSLIGVSLAGGTAHNVGQLLVAMLVLENARLSYYLPVLLISGIVTGFLIGLCSQVVLRRLPERFSLAKKN